MILPEVAQGRIRYFLFKKGNKPIDLTPGKVKYWWRQLNYAVFNGKLKYPKEIIVARTRGCYAFVQGVDDKRVILKIAPKFVTGKMFLSILVHEMVHAWERQHYPHWGHGKRFLMWRGPIKRKTTLPLEVTTHEQFWIE